MRKGGVAGGRGQCSGVRCHSAALFSRPAWVRLPSPRYLRTSRGFTVCSRNFLPELQHRAKALRANIGTLIDERLSERSREKRTDILQAVIDARTADDVSFTRDELIDQIVVLVFAGYDTTASALTWALFILSQQPELAAALREEAGQIAAHRRLAFQDIATLSLARMALLETLRLYPLFHLFRGRRCRRLFWARRSWTRAASL